MQTTAPTRGVRSGRRRPRLLRRAGHDRLQPLDQPVHLRAPSLVRRQQGVAPGQRPQFLRDFLLRGHPRSLHQDGDHGDAPRVPQRGGDLQPHVVVLVVQPPTPAGVRRRLPPLADDHQHRPRGANHPGDPVDEVLPDADVLDVQEHLGVPEGLRQPVAQAAGVTGRVLAAVADEDPRGVLRTDVHLLAAAGLPEQQGDGLDEREPGDRTPVVPGAVPAAGVLVQPAVRGPGQPAVPAGDVRVGEMDVGCISAAQSDLLLIGKGVLHAACEEDDFRVHGSLRTIRRTASRLPVPAGTMIEAIMDSEPRHMLANLLQKEGVGLVDDPQRIKAHLLDACPESRTETELLVAGAADGLAARLARSSDTVFRDGEIARAVADLKRTRRLDRAAAEWVVLSWAWALGVIDEEPSDEEPDSDGPPPRPGPVYPAPPSAPPQFEPPSPRSAPPYEQTTPASAQSGAAAAVAPPQSGGTASSPLYGS